MRLFRLCSYANFIYAFTLQNVLLVLLFQFVMFCWDGLRFFNFYIAFDAIWIYFRESRIALSEFYPGALESSTN